MAKEPVALSPSSVGHEDGTQTAQAVDAKRDSAPLRFVKIRFPDTPSRVAGVYRLMRRTRVVCLPDDEFVISRESLSILEDEGIAHEVLKETSLDETLTALRDSAAPLL